MSFVTGFSLCLSFKVQTLKKTCWNSHFLFLLRSFPYYLYHINFCHSSPSFFVLLLMFFKWNNRTFHLSPWDSSILSYFSSQHFRNEISAHAELWCTALFRACVLCLALVSLRDISVAAKISTHAPSQPLGNPRWGLLLNTLWHNEILMFINETQLRERTKQRKMRRTRRRGEGGEQSASPCRHSREEILRGSQHSPRTKGFIWLPSSRLAELIKMLNRFH